MNDPMNPLVQFSPYAGKLTEIEVPGVTSHKADFENDVAAASGESRTMWCYAPVSGCPDAKQTQVLFVLRDDSSRESAEKLPLRVDFIHRVEFGEVSGHRVLFKRGPGNRGPTECGTTHEATSGMSS